MTRREAEAAYRRLLLEDAARVRAAAERRAEGPVEIRGVEHVHGMGKTDVIRYLCPSCLRYFRSRAHHKRHACADRAAREPEARDSDHSPATDTPDADQEATT